MDSAMEDQAQGEQSSLGTQLVELHFSRTPAMNLSTIRDRAEAILGEQVELREASGKELVALLVHHNHVMTLQDGQVPAHTALMQFHKPIDLAAYRNDINQSWAFPDCEPLLASSRHSICLCEMMGRLLPPSERLQLFHGVLQAVAEVTGPHVLVFKHSQEVVDPRVYLGGVTKQPIERRGSVNVRFFNVNPDENEFLMDTLGMEAIGLHDLQCHYRNLAPPEVARTLYNMAFYLLEHGAVIESGNTVEGTEPGSKWTAQFETAIAEPYRELLDLNPGTPYAGGSR